jgi:hypothetical protein
VGVGERERERPSSPCKRQYNRRRGRCMLGFNDIRVRGG